MERSIVKYLAEYLERVDDFYGETVDISRFCLDADVKKLDIVDDLSWRKDFEKTIGFIQRIMSQPHLHVKYVKEIVKIQVANRLDSEGIRLTMRNPKLWENSENGPRPESVYMTLFEDEYAIYENRFIRLLVDEMFRYLSDTLKELTSSLGNLRAYLGSRLTAAATLHVSGEEEIERSKTLDEKRVLVDSNDPIVETYYDIERLLKKVRNLKNASLYKACKGKPISGVIQPTNILTKDYSYRMCFLFYKRLSVMRGRGQDIKQAMMDNAVMRLIYAIHSAGYRVVGRPAFFRPLDGVHACNNVRFRRGKFTIEINTTEDNEIILTTKMGENTAWRVDVDEIQKEKRYQTKTILKVSNVAAEESKDEAARYRKKKIGEEGYDDAYVIVYSKTPTKGQGVMNFANKGDMACRAAEDIVRSLSLQLVGAHSIFERRCPVCGVKCAASEDSVRTCQVCDSTWSLIMDGTTEKIWLKRIRN